MPSSDRRPRRRPSAVWIDPVDHLAWASYKARGVAAANGFLIGSQEECDLVAVAHLVVCEYARRFDPVVSWRRGTSAAIAAACAAWTRRDGVARVTGPIRFGGVDQMDWVMDCAEAAAKRRRFRAGTRERAALVAVAMIVALARVADYDPVGAFRGWAAIEVKSRCQREAIRLRNGGTFHTCARANELDWQILGLPPAPSSGSVPHPLAQDGPGPPSYTHCDTSLSHDCRRQEAEEPDLDAAELPDPADVPARRSRRGIPPVQARGDTGDTSGWRAFLRRLTG